MLQKDLFSVFRVEVGHFLYLVHPSVMFVPAILHHMMKQVFVVLEDTLVLLEIPIALHVKLGHFRLQGQVNVCPVRHIHIVKKQCQGAVKFVQKVQCLLKDLQSALLVHQIRM